MKKHQEGKEKAMLEGELTLLMKVTLDMEAELQEVVSSSEQ